MPDYGSAPGPAASTVVVGPGAIGTLYAGWLAHAGVDVLLLDHRPERAARLSRDGVCVETPDDALTPRLRVVSPASLPTGISPARTVFICVKAFDTAAAVADAGPFVGPDTLLVSLQNGIGNARRLADRIAPERIACATTEAGSRRIGPGHVYRTGAMRLALSPCHPGATDACRGMQQTLVSAGIEVDWCDDARALVWTKAVINAGINPVAALFGFTNGGVLACAEAAARMRAAVREAAATAAAAGIALRVPDAVAATERVCRETAANRCSMLEDLCAGRHTEIDAITGEIVAAADRYRVPVPVNRDLLQRIHERTTVGCKPKCRT